MRRSLALVLVVAAPPPALSQAPATVPPHEFRTDGVYVADYALPGRGERARVPTFTALRIFPDGKSYFLEDVLHSTGDDNGLDRIIAMTEATPANRLKPGTIGLAGKTVSWSRTHLGSSPVTDENRDEIERFEGVLAPDRDSIELTIVHPGADKRRLTLVFRRLPARVR